MKSVWAPSSFIASAFPDILGRPVRLVRQPVRLPAAVPPPRSGRDTLRLFTQVWATARHEAAVAALRSIYDNSAEADARARSGFALLQSQHALPVAGAEIARLLRKLGALA